VFSDDGIEGFRTHGFLQIPMGKTAYEAVSATFDAALPFFRTPARQKSLNTLPEDGGYRPFGVEYSQSSERPDQMETFTASDRTRILTNKLPSVEARLLHDRMLAAFDSLEAIAETVTIRLAGALTGRTTGEVLIGGFRRWSRLQLNYSHPATSTAPFINETHEDGVLMTLACATGPGLELQTTDGNFVSTTTAPNVLLAMPGEITWLLSGGVIPPLYHRVRRAPGCAERMALLFFGDIHPRLCNAWIASEINANLDIGARVLRNASRFGLHGFTLD
jgi:isopenicillin N synthase-like dioxygenase